jgi:predicted nucleotidyltransferase
MIRSIKDIRDRQEKRRKALEKNLKSIIRQLSDMGAVRIILFGSCALEKVRTMSDLDILCVMPSAYSGREWMKRLYEEVDREVDCDILAFTEEELETIWVVSRFMRHALKTGRVV